MDESTPPPLNAAPPPPPPTPPLIRPPSSAPRQSQGRGWMIFAIVLLVLLFFSGLYNLGNFTRNLLHGGSSSHYRRVAGPRLDEVVREDNDSVNKIAVVEVDGIITGRVIDQSGYGLVDVIRAQLKNAEEDKQVKAVILKVDSPGGEVLASDEIYHAIDDFQKHSQKPVIASMGSLAASGGYYISSPCRWIVANELTITGSIGVIMSSWNYRGLLDKVGVVPQTFKSGKFKDMLSGSKEPDQVTPEEKAMVQSLITETFGRFKQVVKDGRTHAHDLNQSGGGDNAGRALNENWQDYADGRILSGTEAFKLGFVDQLGTFKDAVARAQKLAGISDANLVEYQQRYDLSDLFRMFGKSDSKGVKVDLGMDVPKLEAGRLYFLSPTYLH